ncbi:MAG: SsrA-binding protein SmpB [Candidatus Omnitrophica bacterium]|nr:SsrA-binding protein SmpB [Candidatus Omnitrophota bacterium]
MNPTILNRKAKFDYFLLEKLEAGISLLGHEVKSIREGKVNLKDSFVRIVGAEAFLLNCHISPYSNIQGHVLVDPTRTRKLLLKKNEILSMQVKTRGKGIAIIPTQMYFKRGKVKVEIALGQGKKAHDKRESIKRRIHDKETKQAISRHSKRAR